MTAYLFVTTSTDILIVQSLNIINKLGLHARAASKFVKTASQFESDIQIKKGGREANGKSIMSLMMLAASCGSVIDVTINGVDEQAAFDALDNLLARRFDEEE